MKYDKVIILKNGMECRLRNGTECDGQAVLDNFNLTHGETDFCSPIQTKTALMSGRKANS